MGATCATSAAALRAVAWERAAGQLVQVVLTVVVLLALPSPVQSSMPLVAVALVATAIGVVLVDRARPLAAARAGRGCGTRWPATSATGCSPAGALPAIVLASALVVARPRRHVPDRRAHRRRHRARRPGCCRWPCSRMLAMVLPSVAGWGPREGATAWVFAAAGLGADQGVATAVVYGVMALVASLPGALVLVRAWLPVPGLGAARAVAAGPGRGRRHGGDPRW